MKNAGENKSMIRIIHSYGIRQQTSLIRRRSTAWMHSWLIDSSGYFPWCEMVRKKQKIRTLANIHSWPKKTFIPRLSTYWLGEENVGQRELSICKLKPRPIKPDQRLWTTVRYATFLPKSFCRQHRQMTQKTSSELINSQKHVEENFVGENTFWHQYPLTWRT